MKMQNNNAETPKTGNKIAYILCAVSIAAGALTSLYFYNKSEKKGEIYYEYQQVTAFNSEAIKPHASSGTIKAIDESGHDIDENIYAVRVKIWNAGNEEVSKESIRKTIKINIENDKNIRNITTISMSNKNNDSFSTNSEGEITWDHFDAGDGAMINFVYISKNQENIYMSGHSSTTADPINSKDLAKDRSKWSRWITKSIMTVAVTITVFQAILTAIIRRNPDKLEGKQAVFFKITRSPIKEMIAFVCTFTIIAALIADVLTETLGLAPSPPF